MAFVTSQIGHIVVTSISECALMVITGVPLWWSLALFKAHYKWGDYITRERQPIGDSDLFFVIWHGECSGRGA